MNEEFAVQLKTVLDNSSVERVKDQFEKLKEYFSGQSEIAVKAASEAKARTAPEVDYSKQIQQTAEYSARIQLLERDMRELAEAIDLANKVNNNIPLKGNEFPRFAELSSKYDLSDLLKLEAMYESLNEKMNAMINKQNKLNQKTKENTENVVKQNASWRDVAKKVRSTLVQVLGISAAYSAIRRAMSAYLAQNEELKNKINACWYALGSLFAPVLEWIINLFVTLVAYVDALVKALGGAGINMEKYGKATGKAAKEQKQLAGFDEINNLTSPDSGSGGGGGGGGNPFEDVDVKPAVVEFLANLFKWLPTIIAGLGLIKFAIGQITQALLGTLDVSTMIKNLGIGVAIFGLVTAINALLLYLQDPTWGNFGMLITGIGVAILGVGIATSSTVATVIGAVTAVLGLMAAFWPQISAFLDKIQDGINNLTKWIHNHITTKASVFGALIGGFIELILGNIGAFVEFVQKSLDSLFKSAKMILDGIIKIFRGDLSGGIKLIIQGIVQFVSGIISNFVGWLGRQFSGILGLVTNLFGGISEKARTKIKEIINNWIITPINKLISWLNSKLNINFGGFSLLGEEIIPSFNIKLFELSSLPMLASGTNYVPNDMLAQIHEGEAVIPKEFNSKEYFGGSEETNRLLEQLIEVVDSKEFRAYISQNEIGRTAVNYINSQSRIMGGSLI